MDIQNLKILLAKDEIKTVLDTLLEESKSMDTLANHTVFSIANQYSNLQNRRLKGLKIEEHEHSEIVNRLLNFLSGFQKKPIDEEQHNQPNLLISSINNKGRLLPLDGCKIIQLPEEPPVFPTGCRVSFNVTPNGIGKETIILYYFGIELISYQAGELSKYQTKIKGNQIIGAGTAKVNTFNVVLDGKSVEPAIKIVNATKGKFYQAHSNNFLDTDDAVVLEFKSKKKDNETLKVNVRAIETGLYEIKFVFYYSYAGKDKSHQTDSIFIYHQE